jgi:predicted AAA+ superfamily ATPase
VDAELLELLASAGAVVIEGPKACGKTMTASRQAASRVLLDIDQSARQVLAVDPGLLLEGARPRLLDEWQVAPELWNQVRRAVDDADQPGQFLLTGSAVPADDASRHTGAGRFSVLRMRPMSLFETGASSGMVSLHQLFAGQAPAVADPGLSVRDLSALIARGGWPAQQDRSLKAASRAARDYLEQVRQVDLSRVGPKP